MKEKIIKISVRNLVEFLMRSGDIDNRKTAAAEKDAMQAGSRIHKKIQKSMGDNYQAEVSLKYTYETEKFDIIVEGRADGIISETSGIIIDEIKGIYKELDEVEQPYPVHFAQALCYGFIYASQKQLNEISVQITYANLETQNTKIFKEKKSFSELSEWFENLMQEYKKWAEYISDHEEKRNMSIKELRFPYEYREGQKELAVSVYKAIVRERYLFIQAATGIGKTLSVLYPSLKAVGEGHCNKIFYLTAKTITRQAAEDALVLLRNNGLNFKAVTLTAKEKMCFLEEKDCNPISCSYAKGHFDRVNEAMFEILKQEQSISRAVILKYAEKFSVCPFELSLDLSEFVDGIICDYNYVFDPDARLKRYFAESVTDRYLFLVDEAHNMVSRARDMYSAQIVKEDFLQVKKDFQKRSKKISGLCDRCNKAMLEMKRECDCRIRSQREINFLYDVILKLFSEMESFMEDNLEFDGRDAALDFYFNLRTFLSIFELLDDHYVIYDEMCQDGSYRLKLFCVDPSENMKKCLEKSISTIFFSATLLPILYYKELLSGNKEDYAVYAASVFSQKNRLLMIASDVSSRYSRRNRTEYEKIAEYIRKIVLGKQGNYMVFFPSYHYMEEVHAAFGEGHSCHLLMQHSNMTEQEKEDFLSEFSKSMNHSLIAFCVMGGIFSEGIDLKEDRLIGTIIVGTGLPMVCTEQEHLRNYFDKRGENGFDFAYRFPGMNRVMQAAGRVIRTVNDKGVIALLDDRFLSSDYRNIFPREWSEFYKVTLNTVESSVAEFWEKIEKKV